MSSSRQLETLLRDLRVELDVASARPAAAAATATSAARRAAGARAGAARAACRGSGDRRPHCLVGRQHAAARAGAGPPRGARGAVGRARPRGDGRRRSARRARRRARRESCAHRGVRRAGRCTHPRGRRARHRAEPHAVRHLRALSRAGAGAPLRLDLHLRDAVGRGGVRTLHRSARTRRGADAAHRQPVRPRAPDRCSICRRGCPSPPRAATSRR